MMNNTTVNRRYWKISPGEKAMYWDEFQSGNMIAVGGWGVVKDNLTKIAPSSDKDLREKLEKKHKQESPQALAYAAGQMWIMYQEMQPGDLVCAYGQKQILDWGEIASDYYFQVDTFRFRNRRTVRWHSTEPMSTDRLSSKLQAKIQQRRAIIELTQAEFEEIQQVADTPHQVWLFQANPHKYPLVKELEHAQIDDKWNWDAKQHKDKMRVNDIVVLWQSGNDAAIYATGRLTSAPYQKRREWQVDFCLTDILLERPITRAALKKYPALSNLRVLKKMPRGTNFSVSPEEWTVIKKLIEESIEESKAMKDSNDQPGITLTTLASSFAAHGLHFTNWQIATFYTALQTKGFVILSGISGTGKTKLAQHFAALLPQPHSAAMPQPINVALMGAADPIEDQRKYGSGKPFAYWWSYPIRDDVEAALVTPFHVYIYYQGQITHVHTVAEFQTRTGDQGLESPWLDITLPEESHKIGPDVHSDLKFKTWYKLTDVTKLNRPIELSTVHTLFGYKNHPSALRNALVPIEDPQIEPKSETNWLFVPVRPDWRDSKSLLGYFNPLTGTYEWTPFLRFLLRAAQSYRDGDGLAWFVILDEMNLAHVEYYFADLLSVLESGRDEQGWTREPLRPAYPDDAEGDLPPRELRLPPNLYIVGTVNVDETTHAFSPKVLDRAFTLELTEADFSTYLTLPLEENAELGNGERQALLRNFTFDGRFTGCGYVDKQSIVKHLSNHPAVRTRLQTLNDLLRPYDLHFGYRVFDEILWFLDATEHNELFADLGDYEAALDAAVLMKVLPKFHGSRGKLEAPLRAVLAWCVDPDTPAQDAIADALRQIEAGDDVSEVLSRITFCYPVTAERARRMLRALYTDGFAAFG